MAEEQPSKCKAPLHRLSERLSASRLAPDASFEETDSRRRRRLAARRGGWPVLALCIVLASRVSAADDEAWIAYTKACDAIRLGVPISSAELSQALEGVARQVVADLPEQRLQDPALRACAEEWR